MRIILIFILFLGLLTSCASKKDLIYFQADSTLLDVNYALNAPKIQSGDILAISVIADDLRATAPFNQMSPYNSSGTIQESNPFIPTYAVDFEGYIDFPKIGKIKLSDKTRPEAIEILKREVSKYIVDPGISLEIRNFKVTVLGEVVKPGTYKIDNDRITLLEAIGLAGDLTINGVRKNVLVIREKNGVKTEFRVDLTSRASLNSPVYYLAQNDVIYVEPNGARIQSSKYTQNTSIFVSIASLIITMVAVVVR